MLSLQNINKLPLWAPKATISSMPCVSTEDMSNDPAVPVENLAPSRTSVNHTVVLLVVVSAAHKRP